MPSLELLQSQPPPRRLKLKQKQYKKNANFDVFLTIYQKLFARREKRNEMKSES